MTAALLCAIAGALLFSEREVEGLEVGRADGLTGHAPTNFRHVDINGDGLEDLLFRNRILVQRGRGFVSVQTVALPLLASGAEYDVFDDRLYLRLPDRLEIHQLLESGWERVARQAIAWPDQSRDLAPDYTVDEGVARSAALPRFLHDFSGDGVPEIVLTTPAGLRVYARRDSAYREIGTLKVFPPPYIRLAEEVTLWPQEDRRVVAPPLQLACRYFIEGSRLTVLSRLPNVGDGVPQRVTSWALDIDAESATATEAGESQDSPPLPSFLQPCRLNEDETQDFAGVRSVTTRGTIIPERVRELLASTDGGESFQRFRSKSVSTQGAFIDVDGDLDRDAVLETTGLYDGGPRESVTRALSDRRVRHSIEVHLQNADGIFSKRADLHHAFTLQLARPPLRGGPYFETYLQGALVNLTGDFNGDGLRDLTLRTQPDEVAVYLNSGMSFTKRPDATISLTPDARFAVTDVDGDGRSDIVVAEERAGLSSPHVTVHFSAGAAR